ncbi:unannotated protein [freshwater metagenome]|uniref:Unannotated protein n=1 Tax=freshwater metagenome TaxID=449393 RepID=A0A6J7IAF6_9ZZZZ|nr:ATP-grasp domain-containing protein [Actinomycetota bacterium]
MSSLAGLSPVLIANRGEIAVRVARSLRELGLRSVAVYSDADRDALHVDACDLAVRIGPAEAAQSYLNIPALLEAAAASGARAVHPGYGFLSENAAFAQAVIDAGLVWIGPPPAAIELMGDKARARELAREAGVPVLPGLEEDAPSAAAAQAFVAEHGLPIVVKAVAGGGGKGMRVVRAEADLADALAAAAREAQAAFGDGRVFLERYLEQPRHIEVQLLADAHGACVHLGERECSLQRRHQKVVEECPSPAVGPELRARLGEAAVRLAHACAYAGAGTVEFLVAGEEFFFLEMNTRLQVEHPVTELVYGVDLVELQLRAAAGEPLTLVQQDLEPVGHAIEARLYAEDPAAGNLPSTGTIRAWRPPTGLGVRVDSGVREGSVVETHYDPMLAKVIASGPDRATALERLDEALADLVLLGLTTNAGATRALLARPEVRAGDLDTNLLERIAGDLDLEPPADLLPAAALAEQLLAAEAQAAHTTVPLGWRVDGTWGSWRRRTDRGDLVVEGRPGEPGAVHAGEDHWTGAARRVGPGAISATLDGLTRGYAVALDGDVLWIGRGGHQIEVRPAPRGTRDASAGHGVVEAPMPGTVLIVSAATGDAVVRGDVLMVLESMKMELQITAPRDGVVGELTHAVGDKVARGERLAVVESDEEDA